jgi:hypothetical protein
VSNGFTDRDLKYIRHSVRSKIIKRRSGIVRLKSKGGTIAPERELDSVSFEEALYEKLGGNLRDLGDRP